MSQIPLSIQSWLKPSQMPQINVIISLILLVIDVNVIVCLIVLTTIYLNVQSSKAKAYFIYF